MTHKACRQAIKQTDRLTERTNERTNKNLKERKKQDEMAFVHVHVYFKTNLLINRRCIALNCITTLIIACDVETRRQKMRGKDEKSFEAKMRE